MEPGQCFTHAGFAQFGHNQSSVINRPPCVIQERQPPSAHQNVRGHNIWQMHIPATCCERGLFPFPNVELCVCVCAHVYLASTRAQPQSHSMTRNRALKPKNPFKTPLTSVINEEVETFKAGDPLRPTGSVGCCRAQSRSRSTCSVGSKRAGDVFGVAFLPVPRATRSLSVKT